jgi:phosphomannomutase
MIPWLLVVEIMGQTGKSLSALVEERIALFPASGEINRTVDDEAEVLARIESLYAKDAISVDHMDGVSVEFADWRFNLRASNTEPLVRLNVETRNDPELMRVRTEELLKVMGGEPAE